MLLVYLVSALAAVCVGRPTGNEVTPYNVITLPPPRCPPGQQWINGQCRDIWFVAPANQFLVAIVDFLENKQRNVVTEAPQLSPQNVITVPPNCPAGQQYINGACRDIWKGGPVSILRGLENKQRNIVTEVPQLSPQNVITVPPNCPEGQEYINGACRDVWKGGFGSLLRSQVVDAIVDDVENSIIEKKAKDAMRNIITVPNQCPNGTRPDALGVCRPIFD